MEAFARVASAFCTGELKKFSLLTATYFKSREGGHDEARVDVLIGLIPHRQRRDYSQDFVAQTEHRPRLGIDSR